MAKPFAVHERDVPIEGGKDDPNLGVEWRTLLSGDRTPTAGLTLGVAELAPGDAPLRIHRHAQAEAYYFLSGSGIAHIDGDEFSVSAGSTLFIPGGARHAVSNTGSEPLRLVYVFPTDSFSDVHYEFDET